jgi:hypothetical protein
MNFIASCKVNVQYSLLSVVDAAILWTPGFFFYEGPHQGPHECQGFAWIPGTVNFFVSDADGMLMNALVEVYLSDHIELCSDTFRAIQVPFSVGDAGISIFNDGKIIAGEATLSQTWRNVIIAVPPGNYALVFEVKLRDDDGFVEGHEYPGSYLRDVWCRLTFVPQENPEPAILRADPFIAPERLGGVLLLEAETEQYYR